MLQSVPVLFQWFTILTGNSLRQRCDIGQPTTVLLQRSSEFLRRLRSAELLLRLLRSSLEKPADETQTKRSYSARLVLSAPCMPIAFERCKTGPTSTTSGYRMIARRNGDRDALGSDAGAGRRSNNPTSLPHPGAAASLYGFIVQTRCRSASASSCHHWQQQWRLSCAAASAPGRSS